MKFTATTVAFLSAALAVQATSANEARQPQALITFVDAQLQASYTMYFPADGTLTYTGETLVVAHITSEGGATCTFFGTEGVNSTIVGQGTVNVDPPQAQYAGSCLAL
ncbi:MAG: hypothetical protein M1834_007078 [Cirrosporium novae-zelandiae]|nr:MAG: hypothetical protein M1834_007078 [Cirrosporium novae-zelandiae]